MTAPAQTIPAAELAVGMTVIPGGRVRPVTVVMVETWHDGYIIYAAEGRSGHAAHHAGLTDRIRIA